LGWDSGTYIETLKNVEQVFLSVFVDKKAGIPGLPSLIAMNNYTLHVNNNAPPSQWHVYIPNYTAPIALAIGQQVTAKTTSKRRGILTLGTITTYIKYKENGENIFF
jgi:hypothetical protein